MRVLKSFLISLAMLIGLPALFFGYLEITERRAAREYYANREILRVVFESKRNFRNSDNIRTDIESLNGLKRKAFLEKLPLGTDRETIYRRLAAEDMSCIPESKTDASKAHCMAIGHSKDFRRYYILRFSADDRLVKAEIRQLKGA